MADIANLSMVTLWVILATLFAIVYSLRILVLLERRIARIDHHIEMMAAAILQDERRVLVKESEIERMVKGPRKAPKKKTRRKKK